jgi:hypothetical protein
MKLLKGKCWKWRWWSANDGGRSRRSGGWEKLVVEGGKETKE